MNYGKLCLVECREAHMLPRLLQTPPPEGSGASSGLVEAHWTSTLPEEVIRDINEDRRSVLSEHCQPLTVQQPCFDFTSAGVVNLSRQESVGQDNLLDLLTTTYLKTKRDSNHKKRVTIITAEGLSESYEFPNSRIYWQFIASVKRSVDGIPVTYCNRFTITQSELITSGGGSSGSSRGKYDIKVTFAIRNFKLHYHLPKTDSMTSIDLTTLKALALSDDFVKPLGLLLKMPSFSCNWNSPGGLMGGKRGFGRTSNLQSQPRIFGSLQYSTRINEHKVNSISTEGILSGLHTNAESTSFVSCGPTALSLGILVAEDDRGGIVTLTVNSEALEDDYAQQVQEQKDLQGQREEGHERVLVGSVAAPVLYFLSGNSNSNNCSSSNSSEHGQSSSRLQTLEVSLTAPGTNTVARLMIYSIEEVPMYQFSDEHSSMLDRWSSPKKGRLPDVYCVVYVVLRDGQHVEIKNNKTSICEATLNPIWTEEFLLHVSTGVSEIASVLIKVKDASQGHMRHRHIGQVSLPIEVFVSCPEPALLRLPLVATERNKAQQQQQQQEDDEFLGLISIGTHLVKMQNFPEEEGGSLTTDSSSSNLPEKVNGSANLSQTPSSNPFSSLTKKLRRKSTGSASPNATNASGSPSSSLPASSTPQRRGSATQASVRVNMQRRGSVTNLTEEECQSTRKDKLVVSYETEISTPSQVWYPYLPLPSRGERTGEQSGGEKEDGDIEYAAYSSLGGSCLECVVGIDELLLSVRSLADGSYPSQVTAKECYIRIPWCNVQNAFAVTASSVFLTIRAKNLKEKIATHQQKLLKKDASLVSLMQRFSPSPVADKGLGSAMKRGEDGGMSRGKPAGGRGRMPSSFMKQSSLTNLMNGLRTSSKRNLGEDIKNGEEEGGVMEEMDILIGPCVAAVLTSVIRDRTTFIEIHDGIKQLTLSCDEFAQNSISSSPSEREKKVCQLFVMAMSLLDKCFQQLEKLEGQTLPLSALSSSSLDSDELNLAQPNLQVASRAPTTSSHSCYSSSSSDDIQKNAQGGSVTSVIRIRMYIDSLFHLMNPVYTKYSTVKIGSNGDDDEGGDDDEEGGSECIERACSAASEKSRESNYRGNVSSGHGSTFAENKLRWLALMQHWSDSEGGTKRGYGGGSDSGSYSDCEEDGAIDVHDVIDVFEEIKLSCINAVQLMLLQGVRRDDDEWLSAVLGIISNHYTLLRQLLGYFLAEDEALQRLPGQDNKTKFIKYLVINDAALASELHTVLSVVSMTCSPAPVLLGTVGIKEAMRLYNRCLVGETRKWLYETIKQSKMHREHSTTSSSLPWDIEEIEGKIVSSLPETFRFQMNVFAGLLKNTDKNSQMYSYSRTLSNAEIELRLQLAGLHEEVLRALCKSLLLLSVEFKLTIKSKHWNISSAVDSKKGGGDESTNEDEQTNNLMFLVALGNDSYRMQSVHVTELLRIESAAEWSQETHVLVGSIGVSFEEVCSTVTNQICRVIFSDLLTMLKDFVALWLSFRGDGGVAVSSTSGGSKRRKSFPSVPDTSNVDPWSCILVTTQDFLREMAKRQEIPYINCTFTSGHIARIGADMIALTAAFREHSSSHNGVSLRLNAVQDAVTLITSATTDCDAFEEALYRLVYQLGAQLSDEEAKASYKDALHTLLCLRPDCSSSTPGSDRAKQLLVQAKLPRSRTGRGGTNASQQAQVGSAHEESDRGEDNVILKAYRAVSLIHHGREEKDGGTKSSFKMKKFFSNGGNSGGTAVGGTSKKNKKMADIELLRCLGLVDKARVKSKYDLRELVEQATASSPDSSSPTPSSSPSTLQGTSKSTAVPKRRRSTPSAILAHQPDEFNCQINTMFTSPPKKHLGHSSSGEIVFLKTLNGNTDMSFPNGKASVAQSSSSSVTVTVANIKVKNLVSKTYIGKGNPYVVITLGGMRLKTKVKWNESNAAWSESLVFKEVSRSLRTVGALDVKVYDKEGLSRKTLLGAVTLTIDGIDMNPIESWFALQEGKLGSNGEIFLQVTAS